MATAARAAQSAPETVSEDGNVTFSLHPVPVQDRVNIRVKEEVTGHVGVYITSSTGKSVFVANGDASNFRDYSISTNEHGMAPGLYLVQVKTADGKTEMKRFVKE